MIEADRMPSPNEPPGSSRQDALGLGELLAELSLDAGLLGPAAQLLARQRSAKPLKQPIAVVGPREATTAQLKCALCVGQVLGAVRVPVVCGGKHGVMAAVSEGVWRSRGMVIGLLPEGDTSLANPYLSIALPTGLGITRNALIARAARLMIAVGGGLGTTSEMALALQWGTPVLSMHGAPEVPGHRRFDDESALFAAVFEALLSAEG